MIQFFILYFDGLALLGGLLNFPVWAHIFADRLGSSERAGWRDRPLRMWLYVSMISVGLVGIVGWRFAVIMFADDVPDTWPGVYLGVMIWIALAEALAIETGAEKERRWAWRLYVSAAIAWTGALAAFGGEWL